MRITDWFREVTSSARHRQMRELHRSSEHGEPLPDTYPDVRTEFETDQHFIGQLSDLASSATPANADQQRHALLSQVAAKRQGRHPAEGIPMFGTLLQKRTLAAAGAAAVLIGAAATVGAAGGAGPIASGAGEVLGALQIAGNESKTELCHVPEDNPDNAHTISVGESAVEEHLAHGDTEGACAEERQPGPPDGAGPEGNVEICHVPEGNADNAHTISVAEDAVEEHLAHGDTEGACAEERERGPPDGVPNGPPDGVPNGPPDGVPNGPPDGVPNGPPDGVPNGPPDTLPPSGPESTGGPPEGSGPNRVEVCHVSEDEPENTRTMSVPESALEEHLAHGDTEGACAE